MENETHPDTRINEEVDSKFTIHRKSIYSLATSLSQGPGFGTAVTTVDLLAQTKQEAGDFYLVHKEIFDVLVRNNEYCRTLLEGLQEIVNLLENPFFLENLDLVSITREVPELIQKLSLFFKEKKLELVYEPPSLNPQLFANKEKILLVIEEFLINTIKYSQEGSKVSLNFFIENETLSIQVKNQISNQFHHNIHKEIREFAKEPFIRFYPPGEDHIRVLKYGLGLGLTAIDYIITCHKGQFILKEELNDEEGADKKFVIAQVNLPILK